MANKSLAKAKVIKNDEFYTRIEDIEKELQHYSGHLRGKIILMPCDDPALLRTDPLLSSDEKSSKFWVFFHKNFDRLGLKKIIATHYNNDGKSYKIEYEGGTDNDVLDYVKTDLEGDGDFRSDEIVEIMKSSDVVVTNPPFSLFRAFFNTLQTSNVDFLIIGPMGANTYKDVFRKIQNRSVWWGINNVCHFTKPSGEIQTFGNITWYTNIPLGKSLPELVLYKKYSPIEFPKYDNYNAINVNKIKDIPIDYNGLIGVPTTFLKKWNPKDFSLVGLSATDGIPAVKIDGKPTYRRYIIKRNL